MLTTHAIRLPLELFVRTRSLFLQSAPKRQLLPSARNQETKRGGCLFPLSSVSRLRLPLARYPRPSQADPLHLALRRFSRLPLVLFVRTRLPFLAPINAESGNETRRLPFAAFVCVATAAAFGAVCAAVACWSAFESGFRAETSAAVESAVCAAASATSYSFRLPFSSTTCAACAACAASLLSCLAALSLSR